MSLKDLKSKSAAALANIQPATKPTVTKKPVTSPGQLMAYQGEIMAAEDRIRELEARIKDLESSAIPIDIVVPNPWQPRKVFDEAEIQKLAGSIAEVGLIQPIIVRRVGNSNTSDGQESVGTSNTIYQIVAGERRWRACKTLGKSEIKAVVIDATDEDMVAIALAENFDREDLTAYEIAVAIKNAESAFPSRKSLAAALGINRSDLYDFLAFFALPSFIIDSLESAPGLLGRTAAKDIKVAIGKHGQLAIDALEKLWPRVKSGEIDQGKIASLIEASIARGGRFPVRRNIQKLFVGKEQAGSITRDDTKLKIEIRAAALTPEKEAELRAFVEKMFQK